MLIEQIKKDKMIAMKDKDTIAKNVLVLIIDFAEKKAKEELRAVNDNDVVIALRASINKAQDNINIYTKAGMQDKLDEILAEVAVAKKYLPQETSAEEIEKKIQEIMVSKSIVREPASIKHLMPELKTAFGSALNGKMAKTIIENYLKS